MIIQYNYYRKGSTFGFGSFISAFTAIAEEQIIAPVLPASAYLGTILDTDILNQIQYHLAETANNGASWSSSLWEVNEVSSYFNNRQSQMLAETGAIVSRTTLVTIPNTFRHILPQGWITTTRATWKTAGNVRYPLARVDEWQIDHSFIDTFTTAQRPKMYTDTGEQQLELQTFPPAYDNGVVEILYAGTGATLGNTGVNFTVPDEFVPILKYGIMADMLSKNGRGQDMERAKYCEDRYQEGINFIKYMLGEDNG